MHSINKIDLPSLFDSLRDVFIAQRAFLIELDGKVGDSDLGITMSKAFIAASDSVRANTTEPIAKTLQLAGMAIAKAAPSTMGTLVATGFMRGGKALEGSTAITTSEISTFWTAFLNGIAERGKAQPGDKTVVDVLIPIARSLESSAAVGVHLSQALSLASQAAYKGLEDTKNMMAQHGKAACFQEKTVGLQDAGATVAFLIINTMHAHVGALSEAA
jgi:phosphoenolpyruvate---glycerone phosphotransferase subunit DhaL